MVVLLMELLSSRMGSGDPMAADKGFAAWSLLMPDDEERRRAGVVFLADVAGVFTAGAGAGFAATGLFVLTSAASAFGMVFAFPVCLTGGFLAAAPGGLLPGAATSF
jgi:hypothetical protein